MGTGMAGTPIPDACSNGVSGGDSLHQDQSRPGVWEVPLGLFPLWSFWCLQRHWVQAGGTPRLTLEATQPPPCLRWGVSAVLSHCSGLCNPVFWQYTSSPQPRALPALDFLGGVTVGLPVAPAAADWARRLRRCLPASCDTLCSTHLCLARVCAHTCACTTHPPRHPHPNTDPGPRVGPPQPKACVHARSRPGLSRARAA